MLPAAWLDAVRANARGYRSRRWREGLDGETDVCYSEILEAYLQAESESGEITHAIAALCGIAHTHPRILAGLVEAWITTASRQVLERRPS